MSVQRLFLAELTRAVQVGSDDWGLRIGGVHLLLLLVLHVVFRGCYLLFPDVIFQMTQQQLVYVLAQARRAGVLSAGCERRTLFCKRAFHNVSHFHMANILVSILVLGKSVSTPNTFLKWPQVVKWPQVI